MTKTPRQTSTFRVPTRALLAKMKSERFESFVRLCSIAAPRNGVFNYRTAAVRYEAGQVIITAEEFGQLTGESRHVVRNHFAAWEKDGLIEVKSVNECKGIVEAGVIPSKPAPSMLTIRNLPDDPEFTGKEV